MQRVLTILGVLLLLAAPAWACSRQAQGGRVSQQAINEAVDRGVAWLLRQQCRDGSWGENDQTIGGHRDSRNDLTAFCTYTLIKCRVSPRHPSVQRALAYLESGWPTTTYAVANEVLLYAALGDERWEKRLDLLVDALLELRYESHGTWGYPGHPSIQSDLSNTQYGALALRAARLAGVRIPLKTWSELAERVLLHQEVPRPAAGAAEKRGPKPMKAGFAYLLPNPNAPSFGYNVPNASMTTAGLAILRIVEDALGSRYPGRLRRRAKMATQMGFRWLEEHFSVTENIAGDQAWLYYYLYGLQRVGALYELDHIGEHDWYWEGAAELVRWQHEDGHWQQGAYKEWPRQPMPHANTGYALLFLVKAMAPVTVGSSKGRGLHAAQGPGSPVHARVAVRSQANAWLTGFGGGVLEKYQVSTPTAKGFFVLEVRYYVDDECVATVMGSEERPWNGERYPGQLPLLRNGTFDVHVGVVVRSPEAQGGTVELSSSVMAVEVTGVLEPWMLEHARIASANLFATNGVRARASSTRGEWVTADRAVDGLEASRWLCEAGDPHPTLTLELRRPAWAGTLVLCQADSHTAELGRHPRVKRVAVRINGAKQATEYELDSDVLRPSVLALPRRMRVRELELKILEFEPGREFASEAGFSEVGLIDRR
jgi:hypothetical protein